MSRRPCPQDVERVYPVKYPPEWDEDITPLLERPWDEKAIAEGRTWHPPAEPAWSLNDIQALQGSLSDDEWEVEVSLDHLRPSLVVRWVDVDLLARGLWPPGTEPALEERPLLEGEQPLRVDGPVRETKRVPGIPVIRRRRRSFLLVTLILGVIIALAGVGTLALLNTGN